MQGKKKIKINFIDFWSDLKKDDNYFYNILKKYYDVEISDNPEYVFCSYFSHNHFKYQDCVKIYYTGENIVPDFNLFDYALGFHNISFEDRYMRLPLYALYDKVIPLALKKHTLSDEEYLKKKKFCNYVISNPNADINRDNIIDALEKYKALDAGGRYRNNIGGPVKDKLAFASDYRFSLALENSSTKGYVTEKILEAYAAGTIPIYWGSEDISSEFNPDSFINIMDYKNLEEAVDVIKAIYEDDEAYLKMMKAPIAMEGQKAYECLKEDYLDTFLRNIFDQDYDKAKRRNMVYLGLDYQTNLKDAYGMKKILDVVKKPKHLLNKKRKQKKSGKGK